jgi:DNA repair exonuclease SbcCD ATPase subunit
LSTRLASELDAAQAEYERLAAQAQSIKATGQNLDTEHETLSRLHELRVSIAQHVASAKQGSEVNRDVGALRAAISSVFEAIYVRPADQQITSIRGYEDSAQQIEGGAYWIEPHLRDDAIVLHDEERPGMATCAKFPCASRVRTS